MFGSFQLAKKGMVVLPHFIDKEAKTTLPQVLWFQFSMYRVGVYDDPFLVIIPEKKNKTELHSYLSLPGMGEGKITLSSSNIFKVTDLFCFLVSGYLKKII